MMVNSALIGTCHTNGNVEVVVDAMSFTIVAPSISDSHRHGRECVLGEGRVIVRGIRCFVVPVPPRRQQQRLAARVGQLMQICDELECHPFGAESLAAKLVDVVVHALVV